MDALNLLTCNMNEECTSLTLPFTHVGFVCLCSTPFFFKGYFFVHRGTESPLHFILQRLSHGLDPCRVKLKEIIPNTHTKNPPQLQHNVLDAQKAALLRAAYPEALSVAFAQ